MPKIDTVLLKVASRCNLNCSYCYVYNMGDTGWANMPKQMSPVTMDAAARALGQLYDHQTSSFAVVLHGGEPLVIGASKLEYLLSGLRNALPPECTLNIQTNGILVTREILDLCVRFGATISVSIDGPKHIHDRARRDVRGLGSHDRVVNGINEIKGHSQGRTLFSGILAVIDPTSDPVEIYECLKSFGAPSIDLLVRDGNHTRLPEAKKSFGSTEYGQWLCGFLDTYLLDQTPPRIRLLDDLIRLVLGGAGRKEGVGLTDFGILVVDTDGSITKNDTLKSTSDGADRFATNFTVHDNDFAEVISSAEFLESHELQRPTAQECKACPELRVCGGGMQLHRWSDNNGYDNPSVYCHDQKLLISHIRRWLSSIPSKAA